MFATDTPTGNDPLMGPVDLNYARNCLRGLSARSFLERYTRPALLLSLTENAREATDSALGQTIRTRSTGPVVQAGVALITKKANAKNSDEKDSDEKMRRRITLGRSSEADITVRIATVSSLHLYFERVGGEWTVVDCDSTNGTQLEGEAVAAGERKILVSGACLTIGPDLTAHFLMPRDLYHYVVG